MEAEASRTYDLPPSEKSENWVDEAKHGMENVLQANPLGVNQGHDHAIAIRWLLDGDASVGLQ